MGTDEKFGGSIPSAWMASTPGHPFWLLPLEAAEELSSQSGIRPKRTTGPNASKDQVNVYNRKFRDGKGAGGKRLDKLYARSGWRHLYKASITSIRVLYAVPQCLVVLLTYEIYPYSWWRDGDMFRDACALSAKTFNAKRCKLLLGLEHWGSHSINYWGHSCKRSIRVILPQYQLPSKVIIQFTRRSPLTEHLSGLLLACLLLDREALPSKKDTLTPNLAGSPNRHWDDHIDGLSKSNEKKEQMGSAGEESDEQEEGDAIEANRQAEEKEKQQEEKEQKLEERSTGSMSQR